MSKSQINLGIKFYDDEMKDHFMVDEYLQYDVWNCKSLTRENVYKMYDTQDIMRLFNLSMF